MKMKIKRIRAKLVKKCSLCGKKFDMWDEEENFCFRHRFGYGSKYDCYQLDLKLCCKCFDSLMDELVPRCKTKPLPEIGVGICGRYAESKMKQEKAKGLLPPFCGSHRTATPTENPVFKPLFAALNCGDIGITRWVAKCALV